MYEELDSNNRRKFKELFVGRYFEVYRWIRKREPKEDTVDELAELYITGLLFEPNENTHYTYETEVLRKRDRAKEAVDAVPTKTQKQLELDKALRIWSQMTGWYTDFSSQEAEIKAMEDCGVKRVKRHEMDDERTCEVCRKLDGEVYPINRIPTLPHLRCRRWFSNAE